MIDQRRISSFLPQESGTHPTLSGSPVDGNTPSPLSGGATASPAPLPTGGAVESAGTADAGGWFSQQAAALDNFTDFDNYLTPGGPLLKYFEDAPQIWD